MKLKKKTAIVTGGGSGIGKAIALALANEGVLVAVGDRDLPAAESVAKEICQKSGEAISVFVDLISVEQINSMVKDLLKRWGKIDILINCAGATRILPFMESNEKMWNLLIDVNLKGTIACCHAVLPDMINRRYGKIILIASDVGKVGTKNQAVYSGAKGGVISFCKALAFEMAEFNININNICPGSIASSGYLSAKKLNPQYFDELEKMIPMKRVGKPDEIASMAVFLASDEAGYITGQSFSVNGGFTMV